MFVDVDYAASVEVASTVSSPPSSLTLISLPNEPPQAVLGKANGDMALFPCDGQQVWTQHVHGCPVTALAWGRLSGENDSELVCIGADGNVQSIRIFPRGSQTRTRLLFSQLLQYLRFLKLNPTNELIRASFWWNDNSIRRGDFEEEWLSFDRRRKANIAAALIHDCDKDGHAELLVMMTDRVVRTFRWCPRNARLIPLNKWEVPAQISSFAVGQSDLRFQEAWLSQSSSRQYVSLRLSDKQDVVVADSRKDIRAMIIPYRCSFIYIMGSLISNIVVYVNQKERRLRNDGWDMVGAAIIRLTSMCVVVSVDLRGLILVYAYNERTVKRTEMEPVMRVKGIPGACHLAATASEEAIHIGLTTSANEIIVYRIPLETIKNRFDSLS